MRLKTMLLSGAVLLACAGVVPDAAKVFNFISAAQAQNVSLSFSVFYDGLHDDGDWVNYSGRYVFVPTNVDDNWRPYTRGHWGHTKEYGWVWVSDERFGWATYHYGRWGYGKDIGWYWVPGKRWAPAWVSWRRTDHDIAWAPLPPDTYDDNETAAASVSVSASIGALPFYFWVAVPARNFQDRDLNARIVRDQNENRRIYDRSQFAGPVVIQNNTIVNNVINVNFIEQQSGKPVENVVVKTTADPAAAKPQQPGQQTTITAFQGTLQADAAAKPTTVMPVEQVQQQQANKPKLPTSNTPSAAADQATPPAKPGDAKQPDATKPADAAKQPDATKPADAVKQPDATKPADATKPPEAAKQPDATKPADAAKQPDAAKPADVAKQPVVPKVEPPKVEPPKAEPPKVEPPKAEPPPKMEKAPPPPPKEAAPPPPPKAEPPPVAPKPAPEAKKPAAPPKQEPCKDGQKDCPPAN